MPLLTLKENLIQLKNQNFKAVYDEAISALKRDPHQAQPYFLLGVIASEHKNFPKALELFKKAIDLDPKVLDYHVHLAKLHSTLGQQNAAKSVASDAKELNIQDAFSLDTIGVVFSRAGAHEDAIPLFKKAVTLDPKNANFHYNLAASAQFIGDFKTAKSAYETTIKLDRSFFRAWSSLISLEKQTPETQQIETLTSLFKEASDNAEGQLQIGHALAKTYEDLGNPKKSLMWLLRGKRRKRADLRYDRKQGSALFSSTVKTYPVKTSALNAPQDRPLFIIGLPRTGTTLVDRILSSHPEVTSAGELNIFAENIKALTQTTSNLVMDAETFLKTQNFDLSEIGRHYLAQTRDRMNIQSGDTRLQVDKMPLNFFYAGLIHRALPNARIIALRRGAMDSCLSNFRQLFSTQYSYYNYTFDLEDTAWFYQQFDRLMRHWRDVLPPDRFTEVHYEDIVFDQENQTGRLLEFCGLDWDPVCLRFHENSAPVSTASSVQVRQPLYSGSIGRWKRYGHDLDGLKQALGDLVDD